MTQQMQMPIQKQGRGRPPKAPAVQGPAPVPAVAGEAPAFLRPDQDSMSGFEGIDPSTMSIPFIKMAQPLSPQINSKKSEFIEGLTAGAFFNSVSKRVYGEKMQVIVLAFERLFIEWRPDRGGFVATHSYENAERIAVKKDFGAWKTREGNDLQENYTYFILVAGHEKEGIAVLSLTSTNIPAAKAWNRRLVSTVMSNGEKARPYYLRWDLSTVYTEKDEYAWYKIQADMAGYVDEGQYNLVGPERLALPGRNVDYAQIADQGQAEAAGMTKAPAPVPPDDDEDPFAPSR